MSDSETDWKPVLDWEDLYEVSREGFVRSLTTGRIMSVKPRSDGYVPCYLKTTNRRECRLIHRLVLESFVCRRPEGMVCRHHDGVKTNNDLSNLSWGTQAENMHDKLRHGTNYNLNKVSCPYGHELSGWNLVTTKIGRSCRSCQYAAVEEWRLRKTGRSLNKRDWSDRLYERKQT